MKIAIAPPKSGLQDYIDWLSLDFTVNVLQPGEDLLDYQGLVLTGGADIGKNTERDQVEKSYIDRALFLGLPVLGICRGMQLVNVHLGGTLIQDIQETICNHGVDRNLLSTENTRLSQMASSFHPVFIKDGAIDAQTVMVNSRHHQAIDKLADVLTVTGTSPDGIIEMAENDQFLLVQWHPERSEVREKECATLLLRRFKKMVLDFEKEHYN